MIEHQMKAATCRINCNGKAGTGWVIARNCILTARHCVLGCIDDLHPVELNFPSFGDVALVGKILAQSEEWDTCLLSFESKSPPEPLPSTSALPREGEAWTAFGYPAGKQEIGHRLSGEVAQVLGIPQLKIDLDLSIEPLNALLDYGGLSGAAVVCDGAAVGMIRLKIDGTVAAVSLHQLENFLTENGVPPSSGSAVPSAPSLADREDFLSVFANAVQTRAGNYMFLEGAHGYGKSTFCREFRTDDKALIKLGAYCIHDSSSTLGPEYRAQPEVFFNWLTTAISGLIMGHSPRPQQISYAKQIQQTDEYLNSFSNYCEQSGRQGILFIDGLNEIHGSTLLEELLGLLPIKLPRQVTIVLVAPNFSNMKSNLAGRVKSDDVFALPPLTSSSCHDYCLKTLEPVRRSSTLVHRICEKAQGHPLYLRYLIEFANHRATDDALDDFPILTGPIEDYYRGIWAKLLADDGAVYLLGLMTRLRWGIATTDFLKALNPVEQTQFVSIMRRIRHLRADNQTTTIYHPSFSAFIIAETMEIDELAYRRLADFCCKETGLLYASLNLIWHLLRANDNSVFAYCNQGWVDEAVTHGVEPDALIADVEEVVKRAALEASPDEFIRITLLTQRIGFRYDTLFAQSARLIAEALIILGRPKEALQHVVRLNTLIVDPDDVHQIVFLLHQYGYDDDALMLLDRIQQRILESYHTQTELESFLRLCLWHLQTICLIELV